jgi:hypothetical protein
MVRKTGQIIRRGSHTWLVRIYVGRDPDTRRRKYPRFIRRGVAKDRERTTWARLGGIHARGLLACSPAHAGRSGNQG